MNNPHERIAYLEAKRESDYSDIVEIKSTLHDVVSEIQNLNSNVNRIDKRLSNSLSFAGGMAFAFSLLGGALAALGMYFIKKMGFLA